jgi:hypothetical protein
MSVTAKQGFGQTYKRLQRESRLYKNMSSVLSKLNGDEALQRLYAFGRPDIQQRSQVHLQL